MAEVRFARGGPREVLDTGHLGELQPDPLDVAEAGGGRLLLPRQSSGHMPHV